jgi:hypothetical protein
VVGGLLASTALTLFVVPVLYTLFNRDQTIPAGSAEDAAPPPERQVAAD